MNPIKRGFQVLALLLLAIGLADTAKSADVTLTMEVNTITQSWQLFGEASLGDNDGLASVALNLWNVDFPVDLTLPASWVGTNDWDGFTQGRTDSVNPIGATQDTFAASGLVFGFGQTAGSLSDAVADIFIQKDYDAKLLIAQGDYSTASLLPETDVSLIRVFPVGGGMPFAPTVFMAKTIIPEPSTWTLLVVGGGLLVGLRRRNG